MHADSLGGLHKRRAFRYGNRHVIDGKIYSFHRVQILLKISIGYRSYRTYERLQLLYSVKLTDRKAFAALDATILINDMRLAGRTGNTGHRAAAGTERTACTLLSIDLITNKFGTTLRGAMLIDNVFQEFLAEIL
jgi:hypothetical protein